MTEQEAFLRAIIEKPEDDLCRLVYADWLEEHGEHERAEFIRVQVELERCPKPDPPEAVGQLKGWQRRRAAELRERVLRLWELWSGHPRQWFPVPPGVGVTLASLGHADGNPVAVVRRGFVDEMRCRLADWCGGECPTCMRVVAGVPFHWVCPTCRGADRITGIGPAVVAAHPVTRVVLTDANGHLRNVDGRAVNYDGLCSWSNELRELLGSPGSLNKLFANHTLALAALSAALISWAKAENAERAKYKKARLFVGGVEAGAVSDEEWNALLGNPSAPQPGRTLHDRPPRR